MKSMKKGYLSAKMRQTPNNFFIQNELNDYRNNKLKKRSKYNNLSLNINNNNKEKSYGLSSSKNRYYTSNKLLRSFSTNNYITSFNKKETLGSFSSKNIFSNNYNSPKISVFPTVSNSRGLKKSPSVLNNFYNNNKFFKIEDEKLSQEIYYLKNDIFNMNKKLFLLGKENKEKDIILTEKENEINSIINKKYDNSRIEETLMNKNKIINNNELNINEENQKNDESNNNFNFSIIFNDISLNNYNYNNLFIRIRHQILKAFKEIKKIEEEIKNNKKLNFYTKMNEIDIQTFLYKEQINKINILINNALSISQRNALEISEYELFQNRVLEQRKVLNGLNKEHEKLQNEEYLLSNKIKKMKNSLHIKNNKKFKNINLINSLNKKNEILNKDKFIMINYDNKEKNKKIKQLKKNIEIYKFHYNQTNNEIKHLKEKRDKILENKKINILHKSSSNKVNFIKKDSNISSHTISKVNLNKKIEELQREYESIIKYEKFVYNEMKKFEFKFNHIINNNNTEEENNSIYNNENTNTKKDENENENIKENNNKDNEENLENIINFGLNNDNPFYSEEEQNIPEKTNRFNNAQFGNFAYILFKNFESKNILLNESQNKIINPFLNLISNKNIKEIKYNDESFHLIVNEFSKIIMNALENTNIKNMKLISIFIGALLHNSNYDINKLINYINVLFSYTNNYSIEEESYAYKLQTKYKDQFILLYNKLNEYIKNNLSSNLKNYIPLIKMKEIIEFNNIKLKDKYLEFIYYYMKKFNDPNSNLDDLDFDSLNNLFSSDSKNNKKVTNNSEDNDTVTEITNEEYEKQLKEAIDLIKKGINANNINFNDLVKNITYKAEIDGVFYDYFTIENFNEELKGNKIILSELKLSCLCNKYCLPENLKFIDKNRLEKDIIN